MNRLVNLGAFQVTWLVTVAAAANGRLWPGALAFAGSVALQSAGRAGVRMPALGVLAMAAAIGFAVDAALWALGCLSFPPRALLGVGPVPAWMSLLWANFATTLDESLAWAGDRPFLAAALGAAAGPLSYLSGELAGALHLGPHPAAAWAVAGLWALAFPALALLAKSLRGSRGAGASPAAQEARP